MPRHFPISHLIRIKERIGDTSNFNTLLEIYARRRDMTVTRKDTEGVDVHQNITDYFVPAEILVRLPSDFDFQSVETFGEQTFGQLPFGGRGKTEQSKSIGGKIESHYYVEDVQRKQTVAIVGITERIKGERVIRTIRTT